MNRLQLRQPIVDGAVSLRPFIDNHDLLSGYRNDRGLDPDQLLPPLSALLLPTSVGHRVIVGACSCGETGCGSLALRIFRAGHEVVWSPDATASDETIKREYRFGLLEYLDAVDNAAGDPPPGEGKGRRVARAVKIMLGLYDQTYESLTLFNTAAVDWIGAWPWASDVVRVSLTSNGDQNVHEFTAEPNETEHAFAVRIATEIKRRQLRRP